MNVSSIMPVYNEEKLLHGVKENVDEIRREYQIEFITRYKRDNQQLPDKWAVGIPDIGRIIALYTYSDYSGNDFYSGYANELLDQLLENNIDIVPSLGQEQSLCSLGCGLLYILRNGFAEGDEDEVLAELDRRLPALSMNWEDEDCALYGWIHYLRLRIDVRQETYLTISNKQSLILFLDRLKGSEIIDDDLLQDILKIDALGIFPERTKRLLGKKEVVDIYNVEKPLDDIVTFIIPVRIDSSERRENLNVVLDLLSKRKRSKIIVLEADNASKYRVSENYSNVTYRFVKDDNPIFYRTKYLNELLREADTSVVGIWDADVIVSDDQINRSIDDIRAGRAVMSFPYDGRFIFCSLEDSFIFRHKRSIDFFKENEHLNCVFHSVGGAFLVHKDIYMRTGGENEYFYGWGMEDMERVKRMEIFGLPVSRVDGSLFHLFHYRNENSRFYNWVLENKSRKEFLKICGMSKKQLEEYIQTWKNVANQYENKIYLPLITNSMKIPSDVPAKSFFFGNYFCLLDRYKIAFVAISKNGVTHLKNLVVYSQTGYYPTGEDEAHALIGYTSNRTLCTVAEMRGLEVAYGKYLKFAVWRDPVERLISCYKYFCLERRDNVYYRALALYEDCSFDRFMEYVRFELSKKDPLYQDEHIRRQSDYYCSEDVDYIVPIHKLNRFLEEHGVPLLKKSANETSVKFQLTDPDYIAEIKELYRSDYEIKVNY
ncbi:sulfotransferase family 2 domain-containing protein [Parabacteroides goldsteinii]|uniref:sulfotransferase family 2 domain-containing protein n=1 Tax=Parabacteroides goldsteinii TaxID=328812 RepID=UPI003AB8E92F